MWKEIFASITTFFQAITVFGEAFKDTAEATKKLTEIGKAKADTLLQESLSENEMQRIKLAKELGIARAEAAKPKELPAT